MWLVSLIALPILLFLAILSLGFLWSGGWEDKLFAIFTIFVCTLYGHRDRH